MIRVGLEMTPEQVAAVFRAPARLEEDWPEHRVPELEGLLGELSWSAFAGSSLGVRACAGTGEPAAYAKLFSLAQMRDAIARAHGSGVGYHLRVDTESRGDKALDARRAVEPAELPALLTGGATVCVNRIHRGSRKLRAYLRAVLERTGWRGSVGFNCYLSTRDMGFGAHYDFRHATSLQIAGRKLWTHGLVPSVVGPRRAAALGDRPEHVGDPAPVASWERFRLAGEASPDRDQTELGPGQFLALPAGTWHRARASGFSLALNLYFQHHFFTESLYRVISPRLHALEAWRLGWPATPEPSAEGELPPAAREYAAARLAELRAILDEIDADHPAVLGAFLAQGRID